MRSQKFGFENTEVKNTGVKTYVLWVGVGILGKTEVKEAGVKPYVLRRQKIGFEEAGVKNTEVKPYVFGIRNLWRRAL